MGRGLSPLQLQILAALERLSEEARPKDILGMLGRDPTNSNRVAVSKALCRLIERGLVEKGSALSDTEFLEVIREAEQRAVKANWKKVKARALAIIASVDAAEWNRKRSSPPQSLLSRLNQRYRAAKTTAERREIRMLMLAQLRKSNPSPQRTIYKMCEAAVTPFERYKNATTPAEQREAFKQMAALYRKEHGT